MNANTDLILEKAAIILKYGIILFIIVLFTGTGCASSKKNAFYNKRSQASHINTSQLGRNKYYFSTDYQKKLIKNYKK